jgi:hypothetical protein
MMLKWAPQVGCKVLYIFLLKDIVQNLVPWLQAENTLELKLLVSRHPVHRISRHRSVSRH